MDPKSWMRDMAAKAKTGGEDGVKQVRAAIKIRKLWLEVQAKQDSAAVDVFRSVLDELGACESLLHTDGLAESLLDIPTFCVAAISWMQNDIRHLERDEVLYLHCLCTAFPLSSHCLCTAFPRLSTAFPLPFHCLHTAFPLPFHCLHTVFTLSLHCLRLTLLCLHTVTGRRDQVPRQQSDARLPLPRHRPGSRAGPRRQGARARTANICGNAPRLVGAGLNMAAGSGLSRAN